MTESTTVGDLVRSGVLEFGDGYRTKRAELSDHGYPILRVADVADGYVTLDGADRVSYDFEKAIGSKLSEPGDVLVTTKGTVGRVAVMPSATEQVVYSPQLCYFRIRNEERLSRGYLRQWFKSPAFTRQASHRSSNTDMAPYINMADMRSLELELPDIKEQRAIAEVLGALDDKIAANRKVGTQSRELAATMVSGLPDRVPLNEIANASRRTLSPDAFGTDPVLHFSLPACDNGMPELVTDPSDIKSAKFQLSDPCVLVSKLNPRIPRIWDVPSLPDTVCLSSTEFVVLTPHSGSTSVLAAALDDPRFSVTLQGKVAGTSGSHQRVKPAELLATEVADIRTLNGGQLDSIAALGQLRASLMEENQQLANTRDGLLPLLMSGKLRVKDAEKQIGEVV